jgi:hypothetical protein
MPSAAMVLQPVLTTKLWHATSDNSAAPSNSLLKFFISNYASNKSSGDLTAHTSNFFPNARQVVFPHAWVRFEVLREVSLVSGTLSRSLAFQSRGEVRKERWIHVAHLLIDAPLLRKTTGFGDGTLVFFRQQVGATIIASKVLTARGLSPGLPQIEGPAQRLLLEFLLLAAC